MLEDFKAKYLFILGANNDFINRKPDTFFISNKVRESINNKYKKVCFKLSKFIKRYFLRVIFKYYFVMLR